MNEEITRYAYIDTLSEAGTASYVTFKPADVSEVNVWVNIYGNPTYGIYLNDGKFLLCVDDYGAMNNIDHLSARTVSRKKDL